MNLIFLLRQITMLRGALRYLEHVHTVHWKCSRSTWKKVPTHKMRVCQHISTWFWTSFFQTPHFFHFSWWIEWHWSFIIREPPTPFSGRQEDLNTSIREPARDSARVRAFGAAKAARGIVCLNISTGLKTVTLAWEYELPCKTFFSDVVVFFQAIRVIW